MKYTAFSAESCGGWDFEVHLVEPGAHGPEMSVGRFYNGGSPSWYNGCEIRRVPTRRDRAAAAARRR